jgi:uncharacterized protein
LGQRTALYCRVTTADKPCTRQERDLAAFAARLAGRLFTPLLVPAFKLLLPQILGVRPDELRPIDRIGTVVAPLLIASGTADRYTTINETEVLFDRAPEPKRLWAAEEAGHVDLERFSSERYWSVVLPFLSDHLRNAELNGI